MTTNKKEEMEAAKKAYDAGLGVSEFEAFIYSKKEDWEIEFERMCLENESIHNASNQLKFFISQLLKKKDEEWKEKIRSLVTFFKSEIDKLLSNQ
jgi:hypothetical protein